MAGDCCFISKAQIASNMSQNVFKIKVLKRNYFLVTHSCFKLYLSYIIRE